MSPHALIVWGGWEGHQPKVFAELFEAELRHVGFEVSVEASLDVFRDSSKLMNLSLIVPIWTLAEISELELAGLEQAVRQGVGLGGFHGMCAFSQKPQYLFLTGGCFVGHPGNLIEFSVDITKPEDPIVQGLESFSLTSEQYYLLVDPNNEVLAETSFSGEYEGVDWIADNVMPVVWKRRYGRGRVFYASFGHSPRDFEVIQAREIVKRGLIWAAGAL